MFTFLGSSLRDFSIDSFCTRFPHWGLTWKKWKSKIYKIGSFNLQDTAESDQLDLVLSHILPICPPWGFAHHRARSNFYVPSDSSCSWQLTTCRPDTILVTCVTAWDSLRASNLRCGSTFIRSLLHCANVQQPKRGPQTSSHQRMLKIFWVFENIFR